MFHLHQHPPIYLNLGKAIILPLKVALPPASDISKVNAVISDPPSFPLNIISLSEMRDLIVKSELVRSIWSFI